MRGRRRDIRGAVPEEGVYRGGDVPIAVVIDPTDPAERVDITKSTPAPSVTTPSMIAMAARRLRSGPYGDIMDREGQKEERNDEVTSGSRRN